MIVEVASGGNRSQLTGKSTRERIHGVTRRQVFVTGGTGYLGRALLPMLLARGHAVCALARPGSEARLPDGATVVRGDALDAPSFSGEIRACDTVAHLVGVARPAPWKGPQFRAIDLTSVRAAVTAATSAGVKHFVYVSVAQPAPVMKAYLVVRAEGEALVRASGLSATILRPWYVLGPGHRWPTVLVPVYWMLERLPWTREGATRLGLLSRQQMIRALVWAIEHPCVGVRTLTVPAIRDLAATMDGDLS